MNIYPAAAKKSLRWSLRVWHTDGVYNEQKALSCNLQIPHKCMPWEVFYFVQIEMLGLHFKSIVRTDAWTIS